MTFPRRNLMAGAILLAPSACWGCGWCMFAEAWQVLPPIIPWSILSVGWFVSLSFFANRKGQSLFLIPKPSSAVGIAVVGSVLGFVITGPITMIPLALPCLLNSALAISKSLSPTWAPTFRNGVRWTGAVAIVGMAYFAFHDVKVAREMDIADKMMAWKDSALERMLLTQLKKKEPESLDQYRKLMREASGYILWLTSMRLAEIGEPEIDVPILIEALSSDRSVDEFKDEVDSSDYGMEREFIEKALCELTGLSLPEQTSAEEWEKQWKRKLASE